MTSIIYISKEKDLLINKLRKSPKPEASKQNPNWTLGIFQAHNNLAATRKGEMIFLPMKVGDPRTTLRWYLMVFPKLI